MPTHGSLLPDAIARRLPALRLAAAGVLVVLAGVLLVAPERVAYVLDGSLFAPTAQLSGLPHSVATGSGGKDGARAGKESRAAARSAHADRPAVVQRPRSESVPREAAPVALASVAPAVPTPSPSPPRVPSAAPSVPAPAPSPSAPPASAAGSSQSLVTLLQSSDPMAAVHPETVSSPVAVPLPGQPVPTPVPAPSPAEGSAPAAAPASESSGGASAGTSAPAGSSTSAGTPTSGGTSASAAVRLYGPTRSGLPWHSGFWTGGYGSAAHILAAERWRGTGMDFVTTYPAYSSWDELATDTFAVETFDGFPGRLAYGLPLLPQDRRGQWADVTSGAHDDVFRGIARTMVAHGRGDSVIRVGLEANGSWFPWGVTAATAADYRAAFRRVVAVMRAEAPGLTFWFDTSAGTALAGGSSRLDALTTLYPGDDVVDGISMDHFDFYDVVATDEAGFAAAMRPSSGPGLQDAVEFARLHGKGFGVPEWGLHAVEGPGDSPFFLQAMFGFFRANSDVLVFEDYFNEPDPYIANAIFEGTNNPRSAAVYLSLWGRRSS